MASTTFGKEKGLKGEKLFSLFLGNGLLVLVKGAWGKAGWMLKCLGPTAQTHTNKFSRASRLLLICDLRIPLYCSLKYLEEANKDTLLWENGLNSVLFGQSILSHHQHHSNNVIDISSLNPTGQSLIATPHPSQASLGQTIKDRTGKDLLGFMLTLCHSQCPPPTPQHHICTWIRVIPVWGFLGC